MRILHLLYESKGDLFGIGGVGIRAYEIYRHLRTGHDITFLCKKYPGARDKEIEGLKHVFVGSESGNLTKTLISYAFHAARFVQKYGDEFDIIIEEFSPAIPTFLHLWTKKPLVLQVQGYTGRLYFKKYNPLYSLVLHGFEKVRPRFYSHFIFVSDRTVTRYSLKKDAHFSVIPNGIPDELLDGSPGDGDYILYLGRIDIYGKGLDLLLPAYQEFVRSFPHIRLRIAGDGRDMYRFRKLLSAMPDSVKRNVDLLGWVSGYEKQQALQNALFAVFPSRHEVQPISVLEAMACKKAVLVSDIPEFSFVADQGTGASFRSGDSIALVQSMQEMALSDMRKEMGERAREFVKDRTWGSIAVVYEQFLHTVFEYGRNI
jgi:glycosyltransferase involved in cell wall biosynthesis